jgi:hypothetical protein
MNATAIQMCAAAAAVAFLLAPYAAPVVQKARAWFASLGTNRQPQVASVTERDMHTVLELAARLKAIGCTDGVSLCQELLDVFLTSGKEKVTE